MFSNPALAGRPRPLANAAKVWGRTVGSAAGVIAALITGGLLTADQGAAAAGAITAVDGLIVAVAAILAAGSALVAAFKTSRTAEPAVTPLADPRDDRGIRLVPEVKRLLDPPVVTAINPDADAQGVLRFLQTAHLPPELQVVAQPFRDLALVLLQVLPPDPARTAALWHLRYGKDCAVGLAEVTEQLPRPRPPADDA